MPLRLLPLSLFTKNRHLLPILSFWFFFVLSIGLVASNQLYPIFNLTVRSSIISVFSPVIEMASLPIRMFTNLQGNIHGWFFLHEENNKLRAENQELREKILSTSQLSAENNYLHKMLKYSEDSPISFISGHVIGNTEGALFRNALINIGNRSSIHKGQAVINNMGLVGRVYEVMGNYSRILLLTDPLSRIPIITGKTRERAILSGNNSANPLLLYLPEDTQAEVGETVFTSGDGEIFPPNIPIGYISTKDKDKVSITPYFDPARLEFISVLIY